MDSTNRQVLELNNSVKGLNQESFQKVEFDRPDERSPE